MTSHVQVLSSRDLIVYQTHQRVWPAAQRDVCYVSGIRLVYKIGEETYIKASRNLYHVGYMAHILWVEFYVSVLKNKPIKADKTRKN